MQPPAQLDGEVVVANVDGGAEVEADAAHDVLAPVGDDAADLGKAVEDELEPQRLDAVRLEVHDHTVGAPDRRRPHVELEGLTHVADDHGLDRAHPAGLHVAAQLTQVRGGVDGRPERPEHGEQAVVGRVAAVALRVPEPRLDAQLGGQVTQLAVVDAVAVAHVDPPTSASRSSCTPRRGMSAHVGRWLSS